MVKMVDSVLFEQEWFMDLDLFHRLLYVYLLTRTTNSGMFDVNCRRMSFDMGRKVTEQDIFCTYGNRIVRVPGHESKGIFPSFISFCWKRGKDLDPEKNRVVKGIVSELSRYGLTIQKVEELASSNTMMINSISCKARRQAKEHGKVQKDIAGLKKPEGGTRKDNGRSARLEVVQEMDEGRPCVRRFDVQVLEQQALGSRA